MKQRVEIKSGLPKSKLSKKWEDRLIERLKGEIEAQRILPMSQVFVDVFWIDQKSHNDKKYEKKIILSLLIKTGIIQSRDKIMGVRDHFVISNTGDRVALSLDDFITISDCNTKKVAVHGF